MRVQKLKCKLLGIFGVNFDTITRPDSRPGVFVKDRYALATQFKDITVGRVPKFLSKLTY